MTPLGQVRTHPRLLAELGPGGLLCNRENKAFTALGTWKKRALSLERGIMFVNMGPQKWSKEKFLAAVIHSKNPAE